MKKSGRKSGRDEALFEELRERRGCGFVRAGMAQAAELLAVASAFGLVEKLEAYQEIDPGAAQRHLVQLLHRDLAYDAEVMPLSDAERLVSTLLGLVPDARYFSNCDAGDPGGAVSWFPVTIATFDSGVLAIGLSRSLCVWVEDED